MKLMSLMVLMFSFGLSGCAGWVSVSKYKEAVEYKDKQIKRLRDEINKLEKFKPSKKEEAEARAFNDWASELWAPAFAQHMANVRKQPVNIKLMEFVFLDNFSAVLLLFKINETPAYGFFVKDNTWLFVGSIQKGSST